MSNSPSKKTPNIVVEEPAGIEPKSFSVRFWTGAVYALILLGALIIGNRYFVLPILCVVMACIATSEFIQVTAPKMNKLAKLLGFLLAGFLPLLTAISRTIIPENPILGTGGLSGLTGLFYAIAICLVFYIAWVAFTPTSHAKDAALSFFGALYTGVPLSMLILIREMDKGIFLAPMIVVSVWGADSFAYLGGSLFGRHKLAPVISPKKSWEGFIAGTVGAIIVWSILPYFTHNYYSFLTAAVLGILVSVASLIGDLFESRLKREANVKDAGTLLPGHGGLLDRIDSMLLVSVVMFILLSTVGVGLGVVS